MSYQVLARKYRPSVFSEVAGQTHVLKSLINALDNQRLHHAYLFTGTRGVGKTTLARILAKCLNCEQGVSSTPCGQCSACTEIVEGRFIDLIEVDAASRTKVEDTRDLLENVQYLPTRGRYKVYLIDEVHMLSTHSFNALLKTLEEPPEHVKFLLATTDPQKLPITVLSRCLQFNLKNLSPELIAEFVTDLLEKEGIAQEPDALWQIAMAASGSMRDALTLTDQAISYCEGKVLSEGVTEMLGVPPQQQISKLLGALATRDIDGVLALIREIGEQTPDYQHSLDALLSMLHRIAIAQLSPTALDNSNGDFERINALAVQLSAEDVQLYYQIGLKGRDDLRLSAEMRSAFEMVLLRMLAFSPSFVSPSGEQKKKTITPPESEVAPPAKKATTAPLDCEKPRAVSTANSPSIADQHWLEFFPKLGLTGISANIMANCELKHAANDEIMFVLGKEHSAVFSEEAVAKITPAFKRLLGDGISVRIEVGETLSETPAEQRIRSLQEQQTQRVEAFQADPFVQELIQNFDARVDESSIESIG